VWIYYSAKKRVERCIGDGKRHGEGATRKLFRDYHADAVFIHIPKAAGMSVVNALFGVNNSNHAMARDYISEDSSRFENTFSFAIVRNPYTRLYSAYTYLNGGGKDPIDLVWRKLFLSKYDSFESFVINGGLEVAISCKADHFIPQYEFIFDNAGDLQCDYYGRIEELVEVERFLSDRLNRDVVLGKHNATVISKVNIRSMYTVEMIGKVDYFYRKDFSLLEYEKFKR
tara:strand:- start:1711 stop:2394 length:684 start_codon:yes stop_codon:yes gene_type:complete